MSGLNSDIDKFIETLKVKKVKNIKLPVSAPFHCKLMDKATFVMSDKINNILLEWLHDKVSSVRKATVNCF